MSCKHNGIPYRDTASDKAEASAVVYAKYKLTYRNPHIPDPEEVRWMTRKYKRQYWTPPESVQKFREGTIEWKRALIKAYLTEYSEAIMREFHRFGITTDEATSILGQDHNIKRTKIKVSQHSRITQYSLKQQSDERRKS